MADLSRVIYVSSTKELMSEEGLLILLESFRDNNAVHNITGMLLYQDGNIMQVIEGHQNDIDQLFQNIKADKRHDGVILLVKEKIAQCEFSDWTMSYKNVSGISLVGFSDFIALGSFSAKNEPSAGKAKKLLLSFRG